MSKGRYKIGVSLSPQKSKFGPLLFSGDLEGGLRRAHELGYDGVELSLLNSAALDQEQIQARIQQLDLEVFSIATGQSYVNEGLSLYTEDAEIRRRVLERLNGHVDFAARLGSAVIVGGIRGKIGVDGSEAVKRGKQGLEALRECAGYAGSRDVVILLEPINRYETDVVNSAQQGAELIESCGCGNVKLLLDTFHMNIEEASIEESIRKAGEHLGYIHFADSNRWAPGMGHTSFDSIVGTLVEIGYEGPIVLEILPRPDDEQAAVQGITYMRRLVERIGKK
jgi:sugar phosphate isomerase/epimerase